MDWNKATPEDKVKWLAAQLEDIKRAKALLDRFANLTEKWLKKVSAAK